MTRYHKEKVGAPPGSLIHTGSHRVKEPLVNHICFNDEHYAEAHRVDPMELDLDEQRVHWIEVVGVHDSALIERVGQKLGLHPLFQEDLMNIRQRPKVDDWEDGMFIVLRLLQAEGERIHDGQVSLFVRKNVVLVFLERPTSIFEQIKERIATHRGLIRKQKADFLAYAIIDVVIDHYFILLQHLDDRIEGFEEGGLNHLKEVHECRRRVIYLRKSIGPVREVLGHLLREERSKIITPTTRFYLKDVYDHVIEMVEALDLQRDLCQGLLDVAISSNSQRMNEVIKTLTIVSTIFVPMTFISSFYGMNFVNMPEIHWKWGYLSTIGLMGLSTLYMVRYFRKKRWI